MEYKTTLNLPKTNFPMKANLNQLEPRILAHWKQIDIYKSLLAERKDAPQFLLHDGPPYANGSIHIGHALNKILKDIIIKYKAMRGFYTPYIPGWDCHGLPVEHQLFKELNKTKHDVEIVDFRAGRRYCWPARSISGGRRKNSPSSTSSCKAQNSKSWASLATGPRLI